MAAEGASEELPRAIVRRVVKEKLSDLSTEGDINLHKEALLAFGESARIFIHYLSATAADLCKESKRQAINADDVLKAVEEIEFPELIGPLRAALGEFRKKNAEKRASSAKAKESNKKRKPDEDTAVENGGSDGLNEAAAMEIGGSHGQDESEDGSNEKDNENDGDDS